MYYQHEHHDRKPRRKPDYYLHADLPVMARDLIPRMDKYLRSRGLNPDLARYNGWYPSINAGDNEDRIVIPATPAKYKYWQARAMNSNVKIRYQSPRYSRNDTVIAVWPPEHEGSPEQAVIVEGPMDALAAADTGRAGIALMGNQPPQAVLTCVSELVGNSKVIVIPDRDMFFTGVQWAGVLAAIGVKLRVVQLPSQYKDLATMPLAERYFLLDRATYK